MKIVSPLLKHIVYPGLAKAGYFHQSAEKRPVVLTYHGILPEGYTSTDRSVDGNLLTALQFRHQLTYIKDHYHPITPAEFLLWSEGKHSLPTRAVLLTCDDGLRNNLTEMLPILREFGLACLFFVTTACLEETPAFLWCDELFLMLREAFGTESEAKVQRLRKTFQDLFHRFSHFGHDGRRTRLQALREQLGLPGNWKAKYHDDPVLSSRFQLMNTADLEELLAAGMSIGAHTNSHSMLSNLPEDLARKEIFECREALKKTLGRDVWALAYPFGNACAATSREFKMAEDAGFSWAFMNVESFCKAVDRRFAFPRVHVTADMSLPELGAHLSGFYRSLRELSEVPTTLQSVG